MLYTGEIMQFYEGTFHVRVGGVKLKLSPELYANVARSYQVGDVVAVSYKRGKVKAFIRKGEPNNEGNI